MGNPVDFVVAFYVLNDRWIGNLSAGSCSDDWVALVSLEVAGNSVNHLVAPPVDLPPKSRWTPDRYPNS